MTQKHSVQSRILQEIATLKCGGHIVDKPKVIDQDSGVIHKGFEDDWNSISSGSVADQPPKKQAQ